MDRDILNLQHSRSSDGPWADNPVNYVTTLNVLSTSPAFPLPPNKKYTPTITVAMGKERPLPSSEFPSNAKLPSDVVRLHITPLTAFSAPSLIPPSILDPEKLSTITYHTIEAFPEKSYGYINLPKDQAKRLKKRLKGALFRGVKVHVEEAREESWKRAAEAASEERRQRKRIKREKRKKQEGVLEGTQLPQDRRIARGWAEKDKRDRKECLFKAAIPANRVELLPTEKKVPGEKATKKERKEEKRKKRLIKEFENTQKFPSFLKTNQLDPNKRGVNLVGGYTDGVGWVDGRGGCRGDEEGEAEEGEAMGVRASEGGHFSAALRTGGCR